MLVALGVGVVFAVRAFTATLGPAQDAAASYASALVDQRWDDAQAQLCDRDRSAVTADALAEQYGAADLTGYRVVGISVNSSNGVTTGEAQVVFTTEGGLDTTTLLPLEKDGDDWRPCP